MAEWMRSLKLSKKLGQSIVEFSIVASVLVLLMLGMLVFGELLGWLHTLNNAVRDGARYGVTCPDPDNDQDYDEHIITLVRQRTDFLPNAASRVITVTSMDSNGNPLPPNRRQRGGFLKVEITYDAPVVPIPGILRNPRRLRAAAIFRVECDAPTTPPPTSGTTCSGQTCSGDTCDPDCRPTAVNCFPTNDNRCYTVGTTCSGQTCSGPTCSGPTCSGPTCSGPTCSGDTCDPDCRPTAVNCFPTAEGCETVRGCIPSSRQDTCGFTCSGWDPSQRRTCGGDCNNTSGSRCFQ